MENFSERQIVLDESKDNEIAADFIVVESEVEFLQRDKDDSATRLWVRGNACELARSVYRVRKSPRTVKLIELASPRHKLRELLGAEADKISQNLLAQISAILKNEKIANVGQLLSRLTNSDFWTKPLSLEHAAQWLTSEFDSELSNLIELQRQIWQRDADAKLQDVYAGDEKARARMLERWLTNQKTEAALGEFPLLLTGDYAQILADEAGRRLRRTNGAAALKFPRSTVNKTIYARAALDYFEHHADKLNAETIAHLSPLLTAQERASLENLLPLAGIAPLDSNVDVDAALQWATQKYLPFRAKQINDGAIEQTTVDRLAAGFVDWLLIKYPFLTGADRAASPLNIRTSYTVKELAKERWVLWVVVDGLNYLNHQTLVKLLGEKDAGLRVEQDHVLLGVLPSITERAKYAMTSGKFPQENNSNDWYIKNVFQNNFPTGVYAKTNAIELLKEGLKTEAPTVCYWNYSEIDDCFHEQSDAIVAQIKVDNLLRGLADLINRLIKTSPRMNQIAVVISTDHGQMLGRCDKLNVALDDFDAHGRTVAGDLVAPNSKTAAAFVKSADETMAYLDPTSFRLSEPTTVALGSTYFVDWGNSSKPTIGVHGGLFPEETVVGLSVLVRQPQRKALTATIRGSGETGKPGSIAIEVDNPNRAWVNPVSIEIEGLTVADQSELLQARIAPQQHVSFQIEIAQFPAAQTNEEFAANGVLRYEFEDGAPEEIRVSGTIICKTLYQSKNPSLRDRFKR